MAKDPAFLFYTSDFSTGTQFFSDEQVGKYVRLLLAQHQIGHLHEKHMLQICKWYDEDVFGKFVKDEKGLYYNIRLENEVIKRKAYSDSRSKNSKKKHTYDKHTENEDIISIEANTEYSILLKKENEEKMVVIEMVKVWKKHNPNYLEDKEYDYTACLQMAYKIAKVKGWKEADVIDFKELEVIESWKKIMAFIVTDGFLKNLPLKNLNNQFQMVVQKMQSQSAASVKVESPIRRRKAGELIQWPSEEAKQRAMEEWANS